MYSFFLRESTNFLVCSFHCVLSHSLGFPFLYATSRLLFLLRYFLSFFIARSLSLDLLFFLISLLCYWSFVVLLYFIVSSFVFIVLSRQLLFYSSLSFVGYFSLLFFPRLFFLGKKMYKKVMILSVLDLNIWI